MSDDHERPPIRVTPARARWPVGAALAALALGGVPGAARADSAAGADPAASAPDTTPALHPDFATVRAVARDGVDVLSLPLRWRAPEWERFGLASAAVVATSLAFDRPARDAARRHAGGWQDRVARRVEPFGAEYSIAIVGGFYLAGRFADDERAARTAYDGVTASLLASGVITPALKFAFGRSRPYQQRGVTHLSPFSGDASFPSGHTTQAFAVASVIAANYPSPWVETAAYGLASLVGLSRVQRDAHFLSDVAAGALIGTWTGRQVAALHDGADRLSFAPSYRDGVPGLAFELRF